MSNCDCESFNFTQNLSHYVSSKAASELLLKAKGLSYRKEWKETLNTKTQAKKGSKGEYKKVCKYGNKVKGSCYNCSKPRYCKSNCSELKKGKKGQEEVYLINYIEGTEIPKVVSSMLIPSPIVKDPQRAFFE